MKLTPEFSERTIDDFSLLFKNRQINLEPGFQRRSVWTLSDRRKLIQSILEGYPVPSVFLYKRNEKGKPVYDVIDGKQRLETIFMFMNCGKFRGEGYEVRIGNGKDSDWYDWQAISRKMKDDKHAFLSYKIQTVDVTGELSQIIELFVRINSTGKSLTSQEKRSAKFYDSKFLIEAERLTKRHTSYLVEQKILTQTQLNRMKGTELFAELLMSIHRDGLIDKKKALDVAISKEDINGNVTSEKVSPPRYPCSKKG